MLLIHFPPHLTYATVKHRWSKLLHNTGIYYNYTASPPSIGRASSPPYTEEGTAAQVPKEDQCQELTEANKPARMTRARQLLNQYPSLTVNFMFLLTKSYIHRCCPDQLTERSFYVRPSTRKKNINENRLLRTRSTFRKSVGGRSTDGCRTRSLIVINFSVL